VLRLTSGLTFDAVKVTRSSLGLKRGTRDVESFVRSVSILGDRVVVGSGQSWAKHEGAGSVTSFWVVAEATGMRVADTIEVAKDSPGVPGTAGPNQGWGSKVQAIMLCDGVPGALVQADADSGVDSERETTYATIVSVAFASASSCPGQLLASGVDSALTAIGVARTDPSGTANELPVVGSADPLQLRIGWLGATTLLDLSVVESVSAVYTPAAPAA